MTENLIGCGAGEEGGLRYADAHFRIGSRHEQEGSPCQDYAAAGAGRGLPFAALSDGCSSSGRTDLGARVLTLAAVRILSERTPETSRLLLPAVVGAAHAARLALGLERPDMDATLGAVAALPGGGARAFLFGDGVIAARTPQGIDVRTVSWAGNMPGYPWYATSAAVREFFAARSREAAAEEGTAPCMITRHLIGPAGETSLISSEGIDAAEGLDGYTAEWLPGADSPLDSVAVMTDGALQVAGAEWPEVVTALSAFKAARAGVFVRRRMNKALDEFARRGMRPADDISVAAVAAQAA